MWKIRASSCSNGRAVGGEVSEESDFALEPAGAFDSSVTGSWILEEEPSCPFREAELSRWALKLKHNPRERQ